MKIVFAVTFQTENQDPILTFSRNAYWSIYIYIYTSGSLATFSKLKKK